MPDPYLKSTPEPPTPVLDVERRQRNRMLLAVFLLLFAVAVVLVKDWSSLASSQVDSAAPDTPEAQSSEEPAATPSDTENPPTAPTPYPTVPERKAAKRLRATTAHMAAPSEASASAAPENGIVVTNRAVLPPLKVEVVAGNRKSTLHPGSNSMRVDMDPPVADEPAPPAERTPVEAAAAATAPPASDGSQVHMPPGIQLEVEHATQPEYPMLARQMKVQGSVVLEALVGKDGGIQDLQVLHGPSILADAARQAVRQWRFKPYLQDGQAVETQAHITVNFTISTN